MLQGVQGVGQSGRPLQPPEEGSPQGREEWQSPLTSRDPCCGCFSWKSPQENLGACGKMLLLTTPWNADSCQVDSGSYQDEHPGGELGGGQQDSSEIANKSMHSARLPMRFQMLLDGMAQNQNPIRAPGWPLRSGGWEAWMVLLGIVSSLRWQHSEVV